MTDTLRSDIAHLYRRAGYGASPEEIERGASDGYEATVERMLDRVAPDSAADSAVLPNLPRVTIREVETVEERRARQRERKEQRIALTNWWVTRMVRAKTPFREKLAWIWHDHFATSIDKVNIAGLMYQQNEVFRRLGGGNFEALAQAVAKDPAMMIFLDTNKSRKGQPNENFARELMELFTLGIGNYSDTDVREAARAFTSWRIDPNTGVFRSVPGQLDGGSKTILGTTKPFTGEEVVTLLARHPATANYITSKLWSALAYPAAPGDPVVAELAGPFATDLDVTALCRRIFLHPKFRSIEARQGLVKEPVEYCVGVMRVLGIDPTSLELSTPTFRTLLEQLGQVPFDPPSVGGWPQNGYFVSTATALARLRFTNTALAVAKTDWLGAIAPAARADALAARLGVDRWTGGTVAALAETSNNPRLQLQLALVSPEYVLN